MPIASFTPQLDGKVYAMVASADGTALYVGGSFTGGFAILDPTTGQPKGTQLTSDGEVHALYLDGAARSTSAASSRSSAASTTAR